MITEKNFRVICFIALPAYLGSPGLTPYNNRNITR